MFFLTLLALVYLVQASDVTVLTEDNFNAFITDNEFALVEFYAPWCGHCKRLEPEYEKAATELKTIGSPVVLGKVDATVESNLGSSYKIQGYPTIKFFRSGKPIEYDGGRTSAEIIAWVSKKSGPPSKLITSQEELDKYTGDEGIFPRALLFMSEDKKEEKLWVDTALDGRFSSFTFAHVTDKALFGERTEGTIEIHKDAAEGDVIYDGSDLATFLLAEGFPLVDVLAQESWERSVGQGRDLLSVFITSKSAKEYEDIVSVAKTHKADFVSTWSDQVQIGARWGCSGKLVPTAIYAQIVGGRPSFIVWNEDTEGPMTAESLEAFVTAARAGTYSPYIKSEPIPTQTGPVTVVVGKTFEEVVFAQKDVLIEFYAPWCGHCKKLAPIYDELGAAYKDDDNVVIAKMDATANGLHPSVRVTGYPTILFFDKHNAQQPYDGDRTLSAFQSWIESHRSTTAPASEEKVDL